VVRVILASGQVLTGNDTDAGRQRYRRALRCDAYARMVEVLRRGRPGVQADLFCHTGWPNAP